ncbi:MAG: hypothetical protein IT165_32125 [Bryobacterales bacterium]|nr:hypothetical protein [Bryobacterales bacterium]
MAQPFVVILVIAAAGSVTYAFPAPGRVPVKNSAAASTAPSAIGAPPISQDLPG